MNATLVVRFCPACGDDRAMEQPPCTEHSECPEWICIECGTAVVVGWLDIDAPGAGAAAASISSAA